MDGAAAHHPLVARTNPSERADIRILQRSDPGPSPARERGSSASLRGAAGGVRVRVGDGWWLALGVGMPLEGVEAETSTPRAAPVKKGVRLGFRPAGLERGRLRPSRQQDTPHLRSDGAFTPSGPTRLLLAWGPNSAPRHGVSSSPGHSVRPFFGPAEAPAQSSRRARGLDPARAGRGSWTSSQWIDRPVNRCIMIQGPRGGFCRAKPPTRVGMFPTPKGGDGRRRCAEEGRSRR
jgi:hypothetical protein